MRPLMLLLYCVGEDCNGPARSAGNSLGGAPLIRCQAAWLAPSSQIPRLRPVSHLAKLVGIPGNEVASVHGTTVYAESPVIVLPLAHSLYGPAGLRIPVVSNVWSYR